jgi:hypothetical protein
MLPANRLGLLALLTLPIITFAAAPPYVTGLSGELQPNGEVRVSWTQSTDRNVTKYRLYYSTESILESGGIYDDFEETPGPENVYVFVDPPSTGVLYVTILAVNTAGQESEAFVEEVKVDLSQRKPAETPRLEQSSASSRAPASAQGSAAFSVMLPPSFSSSSSASSVIVLTIPPAPEAMPTPPEQIPVHEPPQKDGLLHLLLAEAITPTQVKLTFSDPVTIEPSLAPQAFAITAPGGALLKILQITIDGPAVLVDTAPQQSGVIYQVKLAEPLMGLGGLPLDPTDRSVFFTGHAQGAVATPTPQQQPGVYDPTRPPEVTGLKLRATAEPGGMYSVTAQWQQEQRADIAHYVVRQSLDRGRTFSDPQVLPVDIAGIELRGVHAGEFGLMLGIVNVYGYPSAGIFESITLPGADQQVQGFSSQATVRFVPTVPIQTMDLIGSTIRRDETRANHLSKTGAGLFVLGSSCIGAYMGWRRGRKRRIEN